MKKLAWCGVLAVAGVASSANAYEFRCRIVERIGNAEIVIDGDTIDARDRAVHNLRIQFGVFDDAAGPAPDGGFLGWNLGSIAVSGAASNSDERRNNGRLSPWTFADGPHVNGNPPTNSNGDPFTMLTEIDNTLGTQSPLWMCNPDGSVPPQPAALVRGRNTFVSTFAFSINPADSDSVMDYTITIGGNVIAATSWRPIGDPVAPECSDPDNPTPGNVTYGPIPTAPRPIAYTLNILAAVPAPGTAVILGLGGFLAVRRRR